jgi:sulfate permease, SulP family
VRADLLAGLTGAVVVLPQGLAFATLAGMPLQHGLYAAMLPCLVAALFGSSRTMVTGPANAISLTTLAVMAPLAAVGSAHYVQLVFTLALLVGVMQVLLGLARAGALVDKVPHSVVVGFTTGAAVLIVNTQLGTVLGLPLPRGQPLWTNLQQAWHQLGQVHEAAAVCAGVTVLLVLLAQPINRVVPALLVALVGGSLFAWQLPQLAPLLPDGLNPQSPLAMVPPLPSAWPPLSLPLLDLETLRLLFSATLVMTLLALTEASAIARSMARQHRDRLDGNQEFIGQGLANLAAAFTSSFPVSGSFNRSAVNAQAGARTPLAAASSAVLLLVILWLVAPWAAYLPLAVVGGLLMVVAASLVKPKDISHEWQAGWATRVPMLITFLATITLSLEWAILLGITSAFLAQRFLR